MIEFPSEQPYQKKMDNIMAGASHRLCVAIKYRDKSGDITERMVEPYEFKSDKLFAHCRDRDAIRAFVVDNIQSALTTNVHFDPRHAIKITAPNYVLKEKK